MYCYLAFDPLVPDPSSLHLHFTRLSDIESCFVTLHVIYT